MTKVKKNLSKKKGQDGRASERVEIDMLLCFPSASHVFTSWSLFHMHMCSLEFLF